jgi:hypothetical protein
MAITYKVLGQSNPAANTANTLYTVPISTSAVISTITICNLSDNEAIYKLAVRTNGAALENKHYIVYNNPVSGNSLVKLSLGITLGPADVLTCNASTSSISFNVFGSEIS